MEARIVPMHEHGSDMTVAAGPSGASSADVAAHDLQAGGGAGRRIDLRRYWAIARREWLLVGAAVLSMLLIGAVVTFLMLPIYSATASVQIDRQSSHVLDSQDVEPVEQATEAELFLATQIGIIESRSLADRAADTLRLDTPAVNFLERMKVTPNLDGLTAAQAVKARRAAILDTIAANLSVQRSHNSRIVDIVFSSPDPVLAAQIANTLAQSFIAANLDHRFESTGYARGFLEQRLADVKAKLQDSERQMIDYARSQRLIDASDGDGTDASGQPTGNQPKSLIVANLVDVNAAYAAAQAHRIAEQQRWTTANAKSIFALPEVLANPTIQAMVQQRAAVRATYQDQLLSFKPDYPSQLELKAQLDELDKQIDTASGNILSAIKTDYDIARSQESALAGQVNALTASTLDERSRGIRYNILRREADTNRILFDALLQRYKEISVAGGLAANNIAIVDRAEVPRIPDRPRPLLNLVLAAVSGLFLGIAIAMLRDRFDDRVRNPDELKFKLGLPIIGVTPKAKGRTVLDELDDSRSDLSEAHSSIRTTLQFATSTGVPSPLLVTSSQQGEGKSTTALATAISFSRIGKRVLLIDGDLRRPSLHDALGAPRERGLSSFLSGQDTLANITVDTPFLNLSFIPCGPLPLNPSELLSGSNFPLLLAEAAALHDLVIVDAPPIMGLADAPVIGANTAATIFVIEAGRTHFGQSKIALNRLREARVKLLGAVLTKSDPRNAGYGDYAYAYKYDYKPAA